MTTIYRCAVALAMALILVGLGLLLRQSAWLALSVAAAPYVVILFAALRMLLDPAFQNPRGWDGRRRG